MGCYFLGYRNRIEYVYVLYIYIYVYINIYMYIAIYTICFGIAMII